MASSVADLMPKYVFIYTLEAIIKEAKESVFSNLIFFFWAVTIKNKVNKTKKCYNKCKFIFVA